MTVFEFAILVAIGFFSGGCNAIVGGGTLFTFPLLLFLGVPPVAANATNTVGLWPASLIAARTYLAELRAAKDRLLLRSVIAVLGGIVGAYLLLASGDARFLALVPWLILIATLLFAFSRTIVRRLMRFGSRGNAAIMLLLELLFSIYGGYFGAGVGILLMASLALAGEQDPQVANAQKNLYGGLINGAAVVIFIAQGAVLWSYALPLIIGSLAGGYLGARAARLIPGGYLRIVVITAGSVLTLIYFRTVYLL
jgi:uncharacterized protein